MLEKIIVRAIFGRGTNNKLKKRSAETESNYRRIEICFHRVARAEGNEKKMRFEVLQLQKQVANVTVTLDKGSKQQQPQKGLIAKSAVSPKGRNEDD